MRHQIRHLNSFIIYRSTYISTFCFIIGDCEENSPCHRKTANVLSTPAVLKKKSAWLNMDASIFGMLAFINRPMPNLILPPEAETTVSKALPELFLEPPVYDSDDVGYSNIFSRL